MNQKDTYEEIAALAVLNTDEVRRVFDAFAGVVKRELKKGGTVRIAKIGKFSATMRQAKTLNHPQTGAPIYIPARMALKLVLCGAFGKMRKGDFSSWEAKDF